MWVRNGLYWKCEGRKGLQQKRGHRDGVGESYELKLDFVSKRGGVAEFRTAREALHSKMNRE
jgi:hypothetical protein